MGSIGQYTVIDCHVHAFEFDEVARGDYEMLKSLSATMDACGYRAINLMSLTSFKDEYMAQNPLCLLAKALHPGRVYAFGSLFYSPEGFPGGKSDFREQAERLIEAGFDGMKMMEGKPTTRKRTGVPLNSPLYDDYYAWLQERQLPLLYHVGDPATFWDGDKVPVWARESGWYYGDGSYIGREALFEESEDIVRKFPRLQVTFAHFYFMSGNPGEASAFLDRYPNVRFDITPGSEMYFDFAKYSSAWRDFFIRYQDRILYGTDDEVDAQGGWLETGGTVRRFLETDDRFEGFRGKIHGICLPGEVLEKIYCKNFQVFAGDAPKKPLLVAAVEECRRLMGVIPDAPYGPKTAAQIAAAMEKLAFMKDAEQ